VGIQTTISCFTSRSTEKGAGKIQIVSAEPAPPKPPSPSFDASPPYESVSITMNYRAVFRPGERLGDREEFVHLLDHLLGSNGRGRRMSEGCGITTKIAEIGQHIQELFYSPHFVSEYAKENEREYLAQGVRFFLTQPDELAISDIELYHFVANCFMNENFWQEVLLP